jgi:hypothetical protein
MLKHDGRVKVHGRVIFSAKIFAGLVSLLFFKAIGALAWFALNF